MWSPFATSPTALLSATALPIELCPDEIACIHAYVTECDPQHTGDRIDFMRAWILNLEAYFCERTSMAVRRISRHSSRSEKPL